MSGSSASSRAFRWEEAALRPNPDYEIVPHDALSAVERGRLDGVSSDPDHFGVLRWRGAGGSIAHAVSNEVALLWLSLDRCRSTSRRLLERVGAQTIERLVLDEILEVGVGDDFVSGPRAAELATAESTSAGGRLAALSRRAIAYAEALGDLDVEALTSRIYRYNTQPSTPKLVRELGEESALASFVGLESSGLARALAKSFRPTVTRGDSGWRRFTSRGVKMSAHLDRAIYKLYVSPVLADLPRAFEALAIALDGAGAIQMKIGRRLAGVLRPDKLVVYFPSFESLADGAARVRARLDGVRAQGVPFTAAIDEAGLLSWGVDPPLTSASTGDLGASYRLFIATRLARALVTARHRGSKSAATFALARLRADGVDTSIWCPTQGVHTSHAEVSR